MQNCQGLLAEILIVFFIGWLWAQPQNLAKVYGERHVGASQLSKSDTCHDASWPAFEYAYVIASFTQWVNLS